MGYQACFKTFPAQSHENSCLFHEVANSDEFVRSQSYILIRFAFPPVTLGLGDG